MWIMVGGPYGTAAKWAAERAANLRRMNEAAHGRSGGRSIEEVAA